MHHLTFTRDSRLRKSSEIRSVRRYGTRHPTRSFIVYLYPQKGSGGQRGQGGDKGAGGQGEPDITATGTGGAKGVEGARGAAGREIPARPGPRVQRTRPLASVPQERVPKETRLGLSVSARTGNAVRRNRLKRLIREFFRQKRATLPQGLDILVVVKTGNRIRGLKDVEEELSFLLTGPGKHTPTKDG